MSEEIKKVEEVTVNPIDEYLNNYKEQKLAEFCVFKDRHIKTLKEENHKYAEELLEIKKKVEQHDKMFENVKELYAEIKKLSVDDYLKLYHMISDDISGKTTVSTITTTYNPFIDTCISSSR